MVLADRSGRDHHAVMSSARRIVIVTYPDLQPLDVVGPAEVFAGASDLKATWIDGQATDPAYEVEVVAETTEPLTGRTSGYSIVPVKTIDQCRGRIDTLIVAGGTGVLELARSGADIAGIVSFHGGLDSPTPEDGKNIRCKVLICHGAADPYVPRDDIAALKKELADAGVDWQMIEYSGAVHSFTQPMAGNDPSRGAAYHEKADRRSWQHMQFFLDEVLGPVK